MSAMTRQRWIYVGLLGLGLVALAADRIAFRPAGAAAASTGSPASAEPADPPVLPPAAPAAPARPNLAQRLEAALAWSPPERDGFRADESWVLPPKPEPAPGAKEPEEFAIAEWEARNPLRSIYSILRPGAPAEPRENDALMTEPAREYRAHFGEREVSAGDMVDGCRVLSIEATTAWVEHQGRCYLVDVLHPRGRAEGAEAQKKPLNVRVKTSAESPPGPP